MVDKLLQTPLPILPCAHEVPPSIVASYPYLAPKHPEAASTFNEISSLVITALKDKAVFRGNYSENSYIQLWDTLIWDTLNFFGTQLPSLDLECNRNTVDKYGTGTTASKTRPDFLCWVKGALILRGEEKASASIGAYNELTSKFGQWNALFYGQLPFVFGYATRGCRIQ